MEPRVSERAGGRADPAAGEACAAEGDAISDVQRNNREADLAVAWAPFAVEFGQSWWLDATRAEPPESEPYFAFALAPFPVEFGASWWIDPERGTVYEVRLPARDRSQPFGVLGSVAVHLLPLLFLLTRAREPTGFAGTIPIQFVIEEQRTAAEKALPVDRPPTLDIGKTIPQAKEVAARPPNETPPAQTAAAVAPPPLKPNPPAAKPHPPPQPAQPPRPQPAVTSQPAQPAPQPSSPSAQTAAATAIATTPAARAAAPGPNATEGDYFSYLVTLTRRHVDLLPMSFLAGRRGETVLSVVVLADGTITHIAIKRSSGYPDIDERIEQMVAAVGRFPPPPPRYQGASLDMDFRLAFPNAVQR